jgi:hypothetical protein
MLKKSILTVFLTLCLFFSLALTSHAATVISIVAEGLLADIAAFEATILTPDTATAADFTNNFPMGWINFSSGKLLSAFDSTFMASLTTGPIGSFDMDVTLGGWELTNQAGTVLTLGTDYFVNPVGTNYEIVVPIPSAIVLLGGGLLGLVALRRRRS